MCKTLLITGADGFIGSHLSEHLLAKNYAVRALSYYNSFNNWGWLETIPEQTGRDISNSLVLQSRAINDESPVLTFQQAEKLFGDLSGSTIALPGKVCRFNSEDTRNSPTLSLANYLREDINYMMHDPYVKEDDQNLLKYKQTDHYIRKLDESLQNLYYIFMCTGHKENIDKKKKIITATGLKGVMDACNIYTSLYFDSRNIPYTGIGRGNKIPEREFIEFVYSFCAMEKGLALELSGLIKLYNDNFVHNEFNKVKFDQVQELSATCSTGCEIADPRIIEEVPDYLKFKSMMVANTISRKIIL